MNKVNGLYRFGYGVISVILRLFFRVQVIGRENIIDGPAIVCGNHSSAWDPVFIGYAFTSREQIHFMAKKQLFSIPFLGWFMRKIGTFPVDRNKNDVSAVKNMMKCLRDGEKVGLFPEGTRVKQDDAVQARSGAVKMSARLGTPIIPVYIPREKKLFCRNTVVIGKPFYIETESKSISNEEFVKLSDKLMHSINGLKEETI